MTIERGNVRTRACYCGDTQRVLVTGIVARLAIKPEINLEFASYATRCVVGLRLRPREISL